MRVIDWKEPPSRLSPPETGELHLWLIDLSAAESIDAMRPSADEKAQAESLVGRIQKQRNQASSVAMREILAGYLETDPRLIEFSIGLHGKPVLKTPESGLEFNLTHSEALALLAISWGNPVGVDIEVIRGRKYLLRIAQRMFGDKVYQSLLKQSDNKRTHTFLEHWTRFESRVKTLGITLFSDSEAMNRMTAVNFRPVENAIAAIAMPAEVPPPQTWSTFRWNLDSRSPLFDKDK